MKKLGISVIAISTVMAGGVAFAASDTSLTTKKYVDDGLNYVYGKVKENKAEIGVKANGSTVLTSTGLYKEIEDLGDDVDDLADTIGVKANGTTVLTSTGIYKEIEDQIGALDVSGLSSDVSDLSSAVSDLSSSVSDLSSAVSDNADAIEALQSAVSAIEDTDTTYNAGTGITIDGENNISVTGLASTTGANADKRYIYQNGTLTELDVASTWNESVLGD